MPVYEFQCAKCGEHFEIVSSLSERDEKAVCPSCGGRKVSQVFGGFTVGISRTQAQPRRVRAQEGRGAEVQAAGRRMTLDRLRPAAAAPARRGEAVLRHVSPERTDDAAVRAGGTGPALTAASR